MTAKRKATSIVFANYTLCVCMGAVCVCVNENSSKWENKHTRHKISSYKQIIDVISRTIYS